MIVNKLTEKIRRRRTSNALAQVLATASPNMRMELIAIAQRQNFIR
jgi:hypothetical protein